VLSRASASYRQNFWATVTLISTPENLAIVDISGGLHASEAAGAQHTIQIGYDLVAGEDPRTAAIRENVITFLWPSLNPDGQTIAEWYRSNVGTQYEVAPMPWP